MTLKQVLSNYKNSLLSYKKIDYLYKLAENDYKNCKVNLGQIQSRANREIKQPKSFSDIEFQVFSQFGDDGIIQWLINNLPIPNKTFIEFGVEDYREANTRFLLVNNYWSGLVMDGSEENLRSIKSNQIYTFYDLQAECAFITTDNINDLIRSARFKADIGILSIDIDGNDYWIWKAIDCIKPVIVICEYNCLFGFNDPYTIEYKEDFVRGKHSRFNFYGASLRSLCDLGEEKGYDFIGCNSAGNNAYFVKKEYTNHLSMPAVTAAEGYVFASFTEGWDVKGTPLRGIEKIKSFDGLSAYNTRTNTNEKIAADRIISSLVLSNKLQRF